MDAAEPGSSPGRLLINGANVSSVSAFDEIEVLSARRQKLWSERGDPDEIERITAQLFNLHEERRILRAKADTGKGRSEIVRSAKLDAELERLMTG